MENTLAQNIIKRHAALKAERSNWDVLWDDVARYVIPRKGNILTKNTSGQEQMTEIYDTTAEQAAQVFAAGLVSQLTPPSEPWFRYEPSDSKSSPEFRAWLEQATQTALQAVYASNFYLAIHEDFMDAGAFATSCIYIEEGTKRPLNFVNIPVGTFSIGEDNEGFVDTVYRDWQWSAKQIEQQWPDIPLPKVVADALASSDPKSWDKKYTVIHACYPRRKGSWKEGIVEGKLREYASCYVLKEASELIEESGFYEKPYSVSRLLRSNNEVYGRGPALQCMPEIKVLNRAVLDLTLAIEKGVNPSWLMPEDAAYRPDNRPNGITYWDATNPNNKPERMIDSSRIDWGQEFCTQKRASISKAFFVDMFQMLSSPDIQTKQMTAREVAERVREKLVLFSPLFARMVQEKLNPMLERVFNIMLRQGKFGDVPPELAAGAEYEIAYTSKIALALKAANDAALLEVVDIAALVAPYDSSVSMVIKWREAFRKVALNRGMNVEDMRTDKEIDDMVAKAQAEREAQQSAQMMDQAAGAVQKLGPNAQAAALKQLGVQG